MTSQGFEGTGGPGRADGAASQGADGADEVARYAAEVRAELADLPADDSAELLEDLEDHLREVAAEDAGVLRERLGEPAAYAAELRESAGLPPRSASAGRRGRPGVAAGFAPSHFADLVADRVGAAERRVRATRAGAETLDFLPSLRPAWWVLRAWIAVRFVEVLTADGGNNRPLHVVGSLGNSLFFGFVLLLAAIAASVWLGKRGPLRGRRRVLLAGGQTVLVLFALLTWAKADDGGYYDGGQASYAAPSRAPYGLSSNGKQITNIAAYDQNGKLLTGVYLYDQNGDPLTVEDDLAPNGGSPYSPPTWLDAGNLFIRNLYPREPRADYWDNTGAMKSVPLPGPPTTRSVPKPVTHLPGGPADCQGYATIQSGAAQSVICEGLPTTTATPGAGTSPAASATTSLAVSPTATATPGTATTPQPSTTPSPGASTPAAPPQTPAPATSSP